MIDDPTLLRRYAADRTEEAFAEFVRRHLPLVYSAALRRLGGDTHHAEDVTQTVFSAVARNAQHLAEHPVLTGWLYTATRNAVSDVVRAERRRRIREQEAHMMEETLSPSEAPADWSRLRPVLDAAMDELSDQDREAVLLRFFQGRPFAEIGATLGLSEDTARKRVERAVDKLRVQLGRKKLVSTSVALATLLAAETVSATPAGLVASVTGAAMATGGVAAGAAALLTVTKLQIGIAAAVVVSGVAGLVTQQRTITELREGQSQLHAELDRLGAANRSLVQTRGGPVPPAGARTPAVAPPAMALVAAPAPAAPPVARHSSPPETNASLHQRYDPFLLGKCGLTPEQADRFVTLKLAIFEVQSDLQAGMEKAGAEGGSAGVEALRSKLTHPLWEEVRSLLGKENFTALSDYESTSALRPMVAFIFDQARAPLSDAQADQFIRIVLKNTQLIRPRPTDLGNTAQVEWTAVVRETAGLLTPAQAAALQGYVSRQKPDAP